MANPHRGEVSFMAGDKCYVMRLSIDAICQLEQQTGRGIITLSSDLQKPENMTLTLTRQILWAMLQDKHPDISVKEAGELIPLMGGMGKVAELFADTLSSAFPEVDKDVSARPQQAGGPKSGTGPRSTEPGPASDAFQTTFGKERHAS